MNRQRVLFQEKSEHSFVLKKNEWSKTEFQDEVRARSLPCATMICGGFGLGDALMITPALRGLKELLPHQPVHVFCRPKEFCIFQNNPNVDLLIGVPWKFSWKPVKENYGRSIHLYKSINGNPKAELVNAYDIFAQLVGVRPHSMIPDYFPVPEELDRARSAMETAGIVPGRDKVAVFQPRASSLLRSIPDETTLDVLRGLEDRGWKTVVVWKDIKPSAEGLKNTFWTSADFPDLELRDIFALVRFADKVIATDSVISHLAGAYSKPSLLIYGPFPAELRASHFTNARSIQADVECGPCFQHGSRCALEGKTIPSCMKQIGAASILKQFDDFTTNSVSSVPRTFLQELHGPGPSCRMCGFGEMKSYARKKNTLYVECIKCGSVQTDPAYSEDPVFTTPKHHYFERKSGGDLITAKKSLCSLFSVLPELVKSNGSLPRALDFGAGGGEAQNLISKLGFEYEAFESNVLSTTKLWARRVNFRTNLESLCEERQGAYRAILLLHSLPYLNDPHHVISKLRECIHPQGVLVVTLFTTHDLYSPSLSPILGTRIPGETPLVPSPEGLDEFMKKKRFRRIWFSKIPNRTSHMYVFRAET